MTPTDGPTTATSETKRTAKIGPPPEAPKSRKSRYTDMVEMAYDHQGEWVSFEFGNGASPLAEMYQLIGRRNAEITMRGGTVYIRIHDDLPTV